MPASRPERILFYAAACPAMPLPCEGAAAHPGQSARHFPGGFRSAAAASFACAQSWIPTAPCSSGRKRKSCGVKLWLGNLLLSAHLQTCYCIVIVSGSSTINLPESLSHFPSGFSFFLCAADVASTSENVRAPKPPTASAAVSSDTHFLHLCPVEKTHQGSSQWLRGRAHN